MNTPILSLLISNNSWKNDFRLHQIFLVLSKISDVKTIVPDSPHEVNSNKKKYSKITILFSAGGILKYIYYCFKKNPEVKIYYVRELLPERKNLNIMLYLFQYLEYFACKISDLVVTGNDERKEIIQSIYNIDPNKIFVWLNMRKLEESKKYNSMIPQFKEKYREILAKKIVLFTSGYSLWRETDKMILQKKHLTDEFVFVVVGGNMLSKSSIDEFQIISNLIKENHIEDVYFFEKVDQDELLFIIRNSYIGCVHYNQLNLNNKFCSSGKIYEFLFEGIPVVTTTNPPLKQILNREQLIGVADDNISSAIKLIDETHKTIIENLFVYNTYNHLITNNNSLLNKIQELFKLDH